MGAGLSSSASLDVCLIYAYASLCNLDVPKETIAKVAQRVEHEYAGTNCGIMDQMIIACAKPDNALLLDCKTLEQQNIPLIMDNMSFVICDTKVKHSLASSAYNTRREECERACEIIGIKSLRDATLDDLQKHKDTMPDNIFSRAKHVITEDIRTQNVAKMMPEKNWADIGTQMYESHKSLQHDYLVSCDESDFIVDCCKDIDGVYGARMTGGGFGGCVIALVSDEHLENFKDILHTKYLQKFNVRTEFYISKAVCGVHIKSDL
jgi:galactokinase